ncbi:MAG TPA: response regulator transcription factor [Balneolaceae bacterium]|nr:response regulator transcription factor [Balneolaceae bacterium]
MINVVIADDHPLVREGIKEILRKEIDIEVTNEASNGSELLDILHAQLPDILVLDMSMPGKSGFKLIKEINHLYEDVPILVLSVHPIERFAVRAYKAGVSGYLHKTSISDELPRAIRKIVCQKRKYIPPEAAEQMALQIKNSSNRPMHESLSDREFQVLCMIAEGKEVSEIAKELSLSPHTIHTYRSRIKEKLNLKSNVEMTRYAIENNLIT